MLQLWNDIKAWFKHSETVFLARLEAFSGLIIGGLSAIDWSPMFTLATDAGMSLKAGMTLGGVMFVKGIVTEWVRRRNTIEVDSKLIPTSIVKEVKTEVTTNMPTEVTTKTDTQTVKE